LVSSFSLLIPYDHLNHLAIAYIAQAMLLHTARKHIHKKAVLHRLME